MRNIHLAWIKVYNPWLIIIVLSLIVIGGLLGIGLGYLKQTPLQIVRINEKALFKEKALQLSKLNLNEAELEKHLSDFKKSFATHLKDLPPNFIVVRSNVLLREDNVLDLTKEFTFLLSKESMETEK